MTTRRCCLGIMVLLAVIFSLTGSHPVGAKDAETVAVLPFRVHALKPLGYLQQGLQKMLTDRIGKRGYRVIPTERVNRHRLAFLPQYEARDLLRIGKDLGCDWIATGSLTQIGKRISLDLKMVDVTGRKPPFFIFMVAEDLDSLPETTERIALSMDYQISGVAQVDSVRVEGNRRIESDAILAVVGTRKGDRLDYDQLDRDLRAVYKMGFFEDVKTETEDGPKGKVVIFRVVEKPSIGKIVFEGNKKIKEDDLTEKLGIKLYSILDQNEIKKGINRIRDFYREKGYYNAEITERTDSLPNNQVQLSFQITENKKVYIRKIVFVGNKKFDDGDLRDIMVTRKKGLFSWFTDSGVLDKRKLEFDCHKIASFYHNHGFVKAKVGAPKVTYKKGEGLIVTIEVQEGEPYAVHKVSVDGDLIRPADELMKMVRITHEKVFNREVIRKDTLALKKVYTDEGYAYADVVPRTREDDKTRQIDIVYSIRKGKKVRFERINIMGNTTTRDKVIRRELKVAEGEYFSGKKLKRSSQNLDRLGYFKDVQIETKRGSRDDLMILDVKVEEEHTGSFSVGAGYSSMDSVVGMASVSEDNLFGRGQKLVASVQLGGKSSQYDITFMEPWIMDHPVSGTIRAYNWKREYDEYTKDAFGGVLTLGWPIEMFDDYTRAYASYQYDSADISDVSSTASYLIREMEGTSSTSSLTMGLTRNSTNRAWNADRGSINEISLEYAGGILGGQNYFNKYFARSAWYFPFLWHTSFMVQGRWGYIKQRSGGDLPSYEKWYLGGIDTVRGFDYADVSPYDPLTLDKVGGEKMMVYNLEYRFPLLKKMGLLGVVFFDAGNVYTSEKGVKERDLAKSVGGGIRWRSPMGPLRIEWGKNLDPQRGEKSSTIEFSMGSRF